MECENVNEKFKNQVEESIRAIKSAKEILSKRLNEIDLRRSRNITHEEKRKLLDEKSSLLIDLHTIFECGIVLDPLSGNGKMNT